MSLLVLEKLSFFALVVVSCCITYMSQQKAGAMGAVESVTSRFANAMVSYVRYLGKQVWFGNLALPYPLQHWTVWEVIGALTFLLIVTGVVIHRRSRNPWALVAWLWFLGTLVPMIGLVQVGSQSMADRYSYIPSVGLLHVLMQLYPTGTKIARRAGIAVAASILVALIVFTRIQLSYWKDDLTLFTHSTQVTEKNDVAFLHLGLAHMQEERSLDAEREFRRAMDINPRNGNAAENLGAVLMNTGRLDEAEPILRAEALASPRDASRHRNLGTLLLKRGAMDMARVELETAVSLDPSDPVGHGNLAAVLAKAGKLDQAIDELRRALQSNPDYEVAHRNLGIILLRTGRKNEAADELRQAIELAPDDLAARQAQASLRSFRDDSKP